MIGLLLTILEVAVIVTFFLIGKHLIPLIKKSEEYKSMQILGNFIESYVNGAEQSIKGSGQGQTKYEKVLDLAIKKCQYLNIPVSEEEMKMLIENAVHAMKMGEAASNQNN